MELTTIKNFLISYDIEDLGNGQYCVNNTSDGWRQAYIDIDTLKKLINKEISFIDLDWE